MDLNKNLNTVRTFWLSALLFSGISVSVSPSFLSLPPTLSFLLVVSLCLCSRCQETSLTWFLKFKYYSLNYWKTLISPSPFQSENVLEKDYNSLTLARCSLLDQPTTVEEVWFGEGTEMVPIWSSAYPRTYQLWPEVNTSTCKVTVGVCRGSNSQKKRKKSNKFQHGEAA